MTLQETLETLQSLTDEKTFARNLKHGMGENQYGIKLGDLRKVAKKIKTDHTLAMELWDTENFDARMLALLVIDAKALSADGLDAMVRADQHARVADWLNSYVVKDHPDNETLRLKWMEDSNPLAARAGWNLTKQRVVRQPETVDIPQLLDRIEAEMSEAHELAQWTMNWCLAEIGIHHPAHRARALAIGEHIGLYSDWPKVKGCTPPYAPLWIDEMVKRQEETPAG